MGKETLRFGIGKFKELLAVEANRRERLEIVNDFGNDGFDFLHRRARGGGAKPKPLDRRANHELNVALHRHCQKFFKRLYMVNDFFEFSNKLVVRHRSTLSNHRCETGQICIPRSELDRIEKRGLEVKG